MKPVYEVVSGQIHLGRREEFYKLHGGVLLPKMKAVGIEPLLFMITEVGRFGRFLDIYKYDNLAEYESKTDALWVSDGLDEYYDQIQDCVFGSIEVQIMTALPYGPTL